MSFCCLIASIFFLKKILGLTLNFYIQNALQKLANRVSQLQQELSGANRREHQHSVDMQTLVFKITHTTDGILRIMNNIYDVMSIDAGLSASHSTNKLAASTENEDFDKDLSNSENYGTDTGSTHSMSHEQKLGNQHHNKSKQSNRLDSNKRDPSSVTEALVQRMQHMQAIATRLEECYERHRQKHKEEITRQDHHLRESWVSVNDVLFIQLFCLEMCMDTIFLCYTVRFGTKLKSPLLLKVQLRYISHKSIKTYWCFNLI